MRTRTLVIVVLHGVNIVTFVLSLVRQSCHDLFSNSVADTIVFILANVEIYRSFSHPAAQIGLIADLLLLGFLLFDMLTVFLVVITWLTIIVVVILWNFMLLASCYALLHEIHELMDLRAEHDKNQKQM